MFSSTGYQAYKRSCGRGAANADSEIGDDKKEKEQGLDNMDLDFDKNSIHGEKYTKM